MLIQDGRVILRQADTGAGSSGPVSDSSTQQPTATVAPDKAPAGDAISLEQALAELDKVRKSLKEANAESAGRRKRLEELETAEQARQQAQMSEAEKATAAAKRLTDDLTAKAAQIAALQQQMVRYEVMLKAQELAIIDLDAATRLIDQTALEFGEDGKPTNVDAVLKTLIKAKPYLVKQDVKSSGLGTPPQRQRQQQQSTGERTVRRITPL